MNDVTFLIYFSVIAALILSAFITVAVVIVKLCKPDKSQSTPQTEAELEYDSQTEAEPEYNSQTEAEPEYDSQTEAEPEYDSETEPEVEFVSEIDSEPVMQSTKTAKEVDIEIFDEISKNPKMQGKSKGCLENEYKSLWKTKTTESIDKAAMDITVTSLYSVLHDTKKKP